MKLIGQFVDDQYPFTKISKTRLTVRGIIMNDEGDIALHHLLRDDMFGHRDYFETPGGGVDSNEDLITALKREISEELGCEITNIQEIGRIIDSYNLLEQRNDIYYYFAQVSEYHEKSLQAGESSLIESTHWVSLDKAKELYESMNKAPLEKLVRQRELPIINEVIRMISHNLIKKV